MSSDTITLKASERKEMGKHVKALRRSGFVPANMYERGKESQALSAESSALAKVYNAAGKHHPVELDVDGKKHLVMIKDVDIDPVKNTLRHVAFHAVNKNEKVEAEIPVRIEGEVPAERISLLVLQQTDVVLVEAIPGNLPDELLVKGELLVDETSKIHASDIKLPNGVELKTDPETLLFYAEIPKDQIAAADAALEENAKPATEVEADNGTDETKAEEATE